MDKASLQLRDSNGTHAGTLTIACLPGAEKWRGRPTLDLTDGLSSGAQGLTVRLLEESQYRYRADLEAGAIAAIEPRELFSADSDALFEGRLRTVRATGTVRVSLVTTSGERYTCDFEVASRKMDYETEYRRMMLRLAEEASELVQSSFAASSFSGFQPDQESDSRTLYQRFAFLQSFIDSEVFAEAVDVIRHRPHASYEMAEEFVDPARSSKPTRSFVQQLARSSRRQPVYQPIAGMNSVPKTIVQHSHRESFDTVPNQFVRFAFEHWKRVAAQVAGQLTASTVQAERGRGEANRIEERLDHLLNMPALADAGPLVKFPSSSTVLHGRAGYRQILRAYLLSDIATSLSWEGGEDVFSAGQRDVATLYEYWVFLELARTIEMIPGFTFDRSELLTQSTDKLGLNLRRGTEVVLIGNGRRRGRKVRLELWFNHSFEPGQVRDSSWTVSMRPDCSLLIQPEGVSWDSATWIHFDAKYRVTHKNYFETESSDESFDKEKVAAREAKREDLRKMHAYRDAIRRTAGAYVLYPGEADSEPEELRQFHEVLPGLGAFVLRPSETGEAGVLASGHLSAFLTDVIDHAAAQGTVRERAQYWEDVAYAEAVGTEHRYEFEPDLSRPPADADVLLGFLRSDAHGQWVDAQRIYNLRGDPSRHGAVDAGSPLVRADFVALYSQHDDEVALYRATGALYVRTGDELLATGYPVGSGTSGTGALYLCLELGERLRSPLNGERARSLAPSDGSPTVLTWTQLAG